MGGMQSPFGSMGGMGGMGAAPPLDFSSLLTPTPISQPSTPQVAPEIRYASQLQQLQDMGFPDTAANLRALSATNGNVNSAVERLLM